MRVIYDHCVPTAEQEIFNMFTLEDARILLALRSGRADIDNPRFAVSPIVVRREDGTWDIGSCFFISDDGVFVTAKHIFESSSDNHGRSTSGSDRGDELGRYSEKTVNLSPFICQFLPGDRSVHRKVECLVMSTADDVAVGRVEALETPAGELISTVPLVISARDAKVGDTLFTFAYPNTDVLEGYDPVGFDFHPRTALGVVKQHYPKGRDRVMLPNPCYETTIDTSGGASGGPVFNLCGAVAGINTSGIGGEIHFVSKIANITEMRFPRKSSMQGASVATLLHEGRIASVYWDESMQCSNVGYELTVLKFDGASDTS